MIVVMVLLCTALPCVSAVEYLHPDEHLDAMPGDIPADTVKIDLSGNRISSVDHINGVLSSLTELFMDHNLLSEFPELGNCSNVTTVSLSFNAMTHISPDRLDVLTRLTFLDIRYNMLQSIPDVPGPGTTLYQLHLSGNLFTEIPNLHRLGQYLGHLYIQDNNIRNISVSTLEQLEYLTHFVVGLNPIDTFPDLDELLEQLRTLSIYGVPDLGGIPTGLFPRLSLIQFLKLNEIGASTIPPDICLRGALSMSFNVQLHGNPFWCDQGMRWLKLAEEAGVGVSTVSGGVTCSGPDHLVGRAWESLAWEDLRYRGRSLLFL